MKLEIKNPTLQKDIYRDENKIPLAYHQSKGIINLNQLIETDLIDAMFFIQDEKRVTDYLYVSRELFENWNLKLENILIYYRTGDKSLLNEIVNIKSGEYINEQ